MDYNSAYIIVTAKNLASNRVFSMSHNLMASLKFTKDRLYRWYNKLPVCYPLCVGHSVLLFCTHRTQVWQFHRRFDEHQPWDLNTNPVELYSVWYISRPCTQWNNCLSRMSGQSTTVQIRHCSETAEWLLGRLWNWSACERYDNVEYQHSDMCHWNRQLSNYVIYPT